MANVITGLFAGVLLTLTVQHTIAFIGILMPWLRAVMSGAPVPVVKIIGMRLRGTPVEFLLDAHRTLVHDSRPIDLNLIESCYLSNRHKLDGNDMGHFLELVELQRKTHESDS